jgi:hypothetical protein
LTTIRISRGVNNTSTIFWALLRSRIFARYRVNATGEVRQREARPWNRAGAAAGLALGRKKMRGRLDRPHLKGAASQTLRRSGRFRDGNHSPGFRARANRLRQPAGPGSVVLGKSRQFRLLQLLP